MAASKLKHHCLNCKFFINEPELVEQAFPGLTALSSAYASVRADAGICSRHELFLAPWAKCRDFQVKQ
jgi:hypothetical protein